MRDRSDGAWRVRLRGGADGGRRIFCQSRKLRSRRGERLRHARAGLARGNRSFAGEIRELLCGHGAMVLAIAPAAGGNARLVDLAGPSRSQARGQPVRRANRSQSENQQQQNGKNTSHPPLSYTSHISRRPCSGIIGKTRIPKRFTTKLLEKEPQKRKFPCLKALPPLLPHSRFCRLHDRSAWPF
jgi:hypothetical protein